MSNAYPKIHLREDVYTTLCLMRDGFNRLRVAMDPRPQRELTIAGTVELLIAKCCVTREEIEEFQPCSRTGRPRRGEPAPTWMDPQKTVEQAKADGRIPADSAVREDQLGTDEDEGSTG